MEKEIKKLEHSHIEVNIKVDEKTWKDAQEDAFKKVAGNVQIPGFRKGKAPLNLVKSKVDQVKVMDEAINAILPKLYKQILEEDKIHPYAQPKVDVTKLSDTELEVKFLIVTAPEVKLGKYTDLSIGKEEVKVTDNDVDEDIKRLLSTGGSLVVKEGAAANGDTVILDFKGSVDGKEFDGGSAENYELVLGSKSFIPGFEDQLVGHKAGDHVDVNVTFPEQYTEELKGKKALFACDIHEVKERKLATLDDEFVKDQGINGVETVDQLKEYTKNKLIADKTRQAKSAYFDKLLGEIAKNSKLDIPDEIIESQADSRKEEFNARMKQSGLTMEQYLQILGQKEEEFNKQIKDQATKELTNYLILEEIGKIEKLDNITDADLEFEFAKLAEQYKMKIEDVKKALGNQLDQFKNQVMMSRIEDFLFNKNN